jgi:hypothetical protein
MERGESIIWAHRVVNVGYWLLLIPSVLLPLFALGALVAPAVFSSGTWGLTLDATGLKIGIAPSLISGSSSRIVFAGMLSAGAVVAWGMLYILRQVKALLAGIDRASPFTLANANRVSHIGVAVIVMGLFSESIKFAVGAYTASVVTVPGLELRPGVQIPWATLFLGLMVMVVAEVFRYGVRLQEDSDLTV